MKLICAIAILYTICDLTLVLLLINHIGLEEARARMRALWKN